MAAVQGDVNINPGGGGGTGLGSGSVDVLMIFGRGGHRRLQAFVVATGAFTLQLEFTSDDGTTWYAVGPEAAAVTIASPNAGTSTYVRGATISDLLIPSNSQLRIKNTSGGAIDYQYKIAVYDDLARV